MILAHAVFATAFVTAIVLARMANLDPSLEEASRDLGAGPMRTFMRVTLPQLAPGIVAGALLAFTLSIDEFVIAFFTTAPTQPTLPIVIYSMVRFGVTPEVNALATILLLVSIVTVIVGATTDPTDRILEVTSAPLLRVDGVRAVYGDTVALHGISLDIADNEFFALLGPSGCGKTTLLRSIAGFETPESGRIEVDGQDLLRMPAHKRPVNMMFQSYALFPHLSVEKNVAYGLEAEGVGRADLRRRVDEVMEVVGLGHLAKRRPAQLSGGQRQRVALARAIVKRPRLLLLDEPLSALDRQVRSSMQLELKRLQHEVGLTFVVVTHDQEEAMSMADRIAVLRDGHLEQLATPQELYANPATRFVASFIGTANLLDGTATAVRRRRARRRRGGGRALARRRRARHGGRAPRGRRADAGCRDGRPARHRRRHLLPGRRLHHLGRGARTLRADPRDRARREPPRARRRRRRAVRAGVGGRAGRARGIRRRRPGRRGAGGGCAARLRRRSARDPSRAGRRTR